MVFHSWEFLLFLPATLLIYCALVKRGSSATVKSSYLTLASLFFYSCGQLRYLPFLLISALLDYCLGRRLACIPRHFKTARRSLIIVSIVVNIGILFFLKYGNWAWEIIFNVAMLFGVNHVLYQIPDLQVPPGISFYTFQTLSYTFDTYRNPSRVEKNFAHYMAYVSFFPQLVAGPIERAIDLIPQLRSQKSFAGKQVLEDSFLLISWGLFKKIVFADNLGGLVKVSSLSLLPGSGLVAVFAFSFQIYCDFSAYTDIARGAAKMFGVNLRSNFFAPYLSASPSEFWRRWHISLSEWIRDYIYIPLGGNKGSSTRTLFNLSLTMLLAGMWHGSGEMFLLWGIYHGFLLVLYKFLPIHLILRHAFGEIGRIMSIGIMYLFTCFGWMMFMSNSFREFIHYGYRSTTILTQTFSPQLIHLAYGLALFTLPIIATDIVSRIRNQEFSECLLSLGNRWRTLLLLAMLYATIFFGKRVGYDFIYFQF